MYKLALNLSLAHCLTLDKKWSRSIFPLENRSHGCQGYLGIRNYPQNMILIVSRSALKFLLNKLWKTKQKPVFLKVILWFFKVYSVRTSWLTSKLSKSYSVDNFWFSDTPGTPGSDSPVEILILNTFYLKRNSVLSLKSYR